MVTLRERYFGVTPARNAVSPGARARGQVEAGDRLLHRTGSNVDDAPEAALGHAVDHPLDEFDRGDHVLDAALQHGLALQVAEVREGRSGVVVHEDVRFACRRHQRLLGGCIADIAGNRDDLDPVRARDLRGALLEPFGVDAVDDDAAPRFGQRLGAGAAEAAA